MPPLQELETSWTDFFGFVPSSATGSAHFEYNALWWSEPRSLKVYYEYGYKSCPHSLKRSPSWQGYNNSISCSRDCRLGCLANQHQISEPNLEKNDTKLSNVGETTQGDDLLMSKDIEEWQWGQLPARSPPHQSLDAQNQTNSVQSSKDRSFRGLVGEHPNKPIKAKVDDHEMPVLYQNIRPIAPTSALNVEPVLGPLQENIINSLEDGIKLGESSPQPSASRGSVHSLSTASHVFNDDRMCKKSLTLSSKQLKMLKLKYGSNEVVFNVYQKFQGRSWCMCHVFLWRFDDQIVISDIDGTITKSDVLGHIIPLMGGQWAQAGVTNLFNRIVDNGYRILYLSSRAIGQSHQTKSYLRSIQQEELRLPDGPLLLSPSSLLLALHREVIERKPEIFKIKCLTNIKSLFPYNRNPFYAGFGNRINDVWAYSEVCVPLSRIYTIDPYGSVKQHFTRGFTSTYLGMSGELVDQIFPPLHGRIVDKK